MAKVKTKYECTDSALIHPIVIDAATLAVLTPPTDPISCGISAVVSRTDKEYGLRPRGAVLSRTVTGGTISKKFYKFVPILTETQYNGADYAIGAAKAIGGVNWTVETKVQESVR